jgi:hypothetical protein
LDAQNAEISVLQISKIFSDPLLMRGMSAMAIPLKYIISQKGPFSKNAPHGKILKKGPGHTLLGKAND